MDASFPTKARTTALGCCGWIVVLAMTSAVAGQPVMAPVSVRVLDEVHLPNAAADRLAQQVDEIWNNQGVFVDRSVDGQRVGPSGARTVYVILRHTTPADQALDARRALNITTAAEPAIGLAWIAFKNGNPSPVIFVSLDHVTQLLARAVCGRFAVQHCPLAPYDELLGRALGRIVAHEIGHYLNGPAHSARGLMKPLLTREDLLRRATPKAFTEP